MSIKNERIASIIKRNISEILMGEIRDPDIGFPTVTDVEVTNDLSFAKIYVTFMDNEKYHQKHLNALEKCKGLIRSKLARVLSTRKCPELIFKYDTSLQTGNRIESLIEELNKQ